MDHHRSIPNPNHLLLLLLLLQGSCATLAQTVGPPPSKYTGGFSTATAVIFGALVLLFFFIALFTLCFYQRYQLRATSTNRLRVTTALTTSGEPGQRPVQQKGIDHSVLETFPIMEYAAVKKLSTVKGPLECAVCLSEFADDESLRLLPGCCHVFHPDCIGQWLENHITCPVCRADLSKPSVSIDDTDGTAETTGTVTTEGPVVIQDGSLGEPSTVIQTVDRFTLRLPRHVIKEIEEARKYRRSVSIAGYAYEQRGSSSGRSGRLRGFIRSFSSVMRREPEVGSRSFKRVFTLTEDAELPITNQSIGSSSSGENQDKRLSKVSEMALLDRV
jgi:Ring finger domain